MDKLFAYGSLMCEEIMHCVSASRPQRLQARLHGYQRRAVRLETYPAITAGDTGIVDGILYVGLGDLAWQRLDRFEGSMYRRQTVDIELADGTSTMAQTYVIQPHQLHRLAPGDWDYQRFLSRHKNDFISNYIGYERV